MKLNSKDSLKIARAAAATLACAAASTAMAQNATNSMVDPAVPVDGEIKPPTEQTNQVQQQNWNLHAQSTAIVQGYPGFASEYSGPNSLPSGGQVRETVSLDLMAGVRLWSGAEAHVDGLMWQGFGVGNALGVESFPSGEAFRLGTGVPNGAITRLFVRQTIGLGGEQEDVPDTQLTLAGKQDISRVTFTAGRFSAKDIFDNNAYANDARTQFMSWGLTANEAWDYPADAIGYNTGFAVELNQPKWAVRYGFFNVPRFQNSLTAEDRILKWPFDDSAQNGPFLRTFGMVAELERRYDINNHQGTIRFLAFVNRANMADYSAATAILLANGPGADISAARMYRCKYGFGLNWEQEITKDIGVFSRLGWNDDQEEGWMFSDVGHAASLGISVNGESWYRPNDTFGLAGVISGISKSAQEFFQAGGLGILAGDGNLNYSPEKVMETYYSFQVWKSIYVSLNYQFVYDPAFNQARGPVSVFGARLHWEF